jgi:hypothetical protein
VTRAERARTELWRVAADAARDEDGAVREDWRRWELSGAVAAAERAGLLPADELAAWRSLVDGGALPPPAGADAAAAAAHLDGLRAALVPDARTPDPAGRAARRRFDGALAVLHEVGLVSDEDERAWRRRALEATAPWLDAAAVAEVVATPGWVAIPVPPPTPEEAAEDERRAALRPPRTVPGAVRRVLLVDAVAYSADGLAVAAAVDREGVLELHVHHRITTVPDRGPFGPPPALRDDRGTTYAPAHDHPSAGGPGAGATGAWRYVPPLDPAATRLVAERDGTAWTLA